MKEKILIIFVFTLLIAFTVLPASGDVLKEKSPLIIWDGDIIYVGGSGPNNHSTIQGGINAANPGYTVFVYDDSSPYVENIVIDKLIILVGENKDTTIIDGDIPYSDHTIDIISGDSIVREFTVTGRGIYIGSNNNLLEDCDVVDNGYEGLIIGGKNNHISNCYFSGNFNHGGLDINGISNIVSNCTFDGDSVHIGDGPYNQLYDCFFYGGFAQLGIGGDYTRIENCVMESVSWVSIGIYANHLLLKNCIINNSTTEAIYTDSHYDYNDIQLINCTISNSGEEGIYFGGNFQNCVISGCRFINNAESAIFITGVFNFFEISYCHFEGNKYGLTMYFSNYFNRFYRNNFIDQKRHIHPYLFGSDFLFMINFFKYNYWDDWIGFGPYHVHGWINWDFYPMEEPNDITTSQGFGIK
jgi:parallel beta-helix repeat protein